jgi:sulfatase modifying factor 1
MKIRHLLLASLAALTLTHAPSVDAQIAPAELVAPKLEISGGNMNFTVQPSVLGRSYHLQYSGTMADDSWQNSGVVQIGDGNSLVISIPYEPGMPRRFYRLVLDGAPAVPPIPAGFEQIPAGSFQMGDALDGNSFALPIHAVRVSSFFMAKFEVTKELWDDVRSWGTSNGYTDLMTGSGKGATHPIQTISWYSMVKWCNARSEKEGLTPCYTLAGVVYRTTNNFLVECNWSANGYRLPTEAEWEMAARGGLSGKRFPWGDTITHSQTNYYVRSDNGTTNYYNYDVSLTRGYHPDYVVSGTPYTSPVGSFVANGYGLYDMAGNVSEWCWDWSKSYTSESQVDPRGPPPGNNRVGRGGGWASWATACSAANRGGYDPSFGTYSMGFRLARSSP